MAGRGSLEAGHSRRPMGGELPRQLSSQQRFILAFVRHWIRNREGVDDRAVPFQTVSLATARELDRGGDRLQPRDPGAAQAADVDFSAQFVEDPDADGRERQAIQITSNHSSSFSRAVDSLERRELVDSSLGEGGRRPKRTAIRLTPAGEAAADELLRRHRDGRYNLTFARLDSGDGPD